MIRKIIIALWFLLACAFFIQAFCKQAIFPFTLISGIFSVDKVTPYTFFFFPFAEYAIKFIIVMAEFIYRVSKKTAARSNLSFARQVLFFFTDLYIWLAAMFISVFFSFSIVLIGYIPNEGPVLLFFMANVFFSSFCFFKAIMECINAKEGIHNLTNFSAIRSG